MQCVLNVLKKVALYKRLFDHSFAKWSLDVFSDVLVITSYGIKKAPDVENSGIS